MNSQIIRSLILLLILATYAAEPVLSQNQEQLFQQALMKEEGEGALQEAIDIYSKIVVNSAAERPLQAKAQLQIGLCYEKLGKKQASEAYNKVLEQFADQQQTAEIAKTRLQNLNSQIVSLQENPVKQTINIIPFAGELSPYTGMDVSPDGKSIVFVETPRSRIYITDISGAPVRPLLEESEFMRETQPKFSPDGKYVAFKAYQNHSNSFIYIYDIIENKLKKFCSVDPNVFMGWPIWHPDGHHISAAFPMGIMSYNLNGEITDSILMQMDNRVKLAGYSPDGKWISYWKIDSSKKNDCWLVSSSGDKQVSLTDSRGINDGWGSWSGKDYALYFASDKNSAPNASRLGKSFNVFKLNIDPETGEKKGEAEQITYYQDVNVLYPTIVKDKNALFYGLKKEFVQIVIPENDKFDSLKTIATGTNPVISPDGETVYFAGTGKDNQGIYSVPRKGGTKKRLTNLIPTDSYFNYNYFTLSPDGSTITFLTKIDDNNVELCFLSTDGGKLLNAITIETNQIVGRDPSLDIVPTWSPDSKKVAFGYNNTVYTLPAWGNKEEKFADVKGWEQYSTKWSPDGKYIAGFVDDNDIGNLNVVIVSTQTGEIKKLTTNVEKEYKENLEWHPDGDKLTYFLYYNGEDGLNTEPDDADQIRVAYVDGSPTAEIIDQPDVWDYTGVWDPTGSNYYFEGWVAETQQWQLNKFNAESKEFILLPFTISDHELPSFSKDGKHIVIRKVKTENQLWMMEGVE